MRKTKKSNPTMQHNQSAELGVMSLKSSPVPCPEDMQKYQQIYPDAPKIFFDLLEKQSTHRRSMEEKIIKSSITSSYIGQIFAFIIAIGSIAGGLALIWNDKSAQGFGVILTSLLPIVGTFLFGKNKTKKEQKNSLR